jgi:N6-adenosine-specific RNA methylase IME4
VSVQGLVGITGTFPTLVADPPWQYGNTKTRNAADKHYPTMTVGELCELPVGVHAAESAHLYLWTTAPFLREAFEVMDAWGFTYKTNLVWVKPQIGMGNYFRVSHEHVLFGVRGTAPMLTPAKSTRSWFQADRREHSTKPDAFLDLVERCSPSPGLELFARRQRMSAAFEWTYWGNGE